MDMGRRKASGGDDSGGYQDRQDRRLDIFISWSGEPSKHIASILNSWIPLIFHEVETWVSQENLSAGSRWGDGISRALNRINFGILCLSPNNLKSPWLNFEAGALSKIFDTSRVVPVLYGLTPTDVEPPLSQFNCVELDRPGLLKLCESINEYYPPRRRPEQLSDSFNACWPVFESKLSGIPKGGGAVKSKRTDHEMIVEILELVRAIPREIPQKVTSFDPHSFKIGFAHDLYMKLFSMQRRQIRIVLLKQPPDVLLMLMRTVHFQDNQDNEYFDKDCEISEVLREVWEDLPDIWTTDRNDPRF